MNYQDAVDEIMNIPRYGNVAGTGRAKQALLRTGYEPGEAKVIHVAGTNGKGSVCTYLTNILIGQGYTVGTFISPHLVSVNERIRINNKIITNEEFLSAYEKVAENTENLGLTFFDFLFVMAMKIFQEKKVEYIVLETGLGGRYDSTNAIDKKEACIITSISLDHTQVLGDTVSAIAREKAGIIREGVPVIFWGEEKEVRDTIIRECEEKKAPYFIVDSKKIALNKNSRKNIDFFYDNMYYKNCIISLDTVAGYQAENCALALEAVSVLDKKNTFDKDKITASVKTTFWEGRMEEIRPDVYIDGAHNYDGLRVFLETVARIDAGKKTLLFTAVADKKYHAMIEEICKSGIFDKYIVTQLSCERGLSAEELHNTFGQYTRQDIDVYDNVKDALYSALSEKKENDSLFCAGSLYLVGEIKACIGEYRE